MPLVFALVDIPLFHHPLKGFLHAYFVAGICGADEMIIINLKIIPQMPEFRADLIHIVFGVAGFLFG